MTGGRTQLAIEVVVSYQLHTIVLAGEMDMAGVPELTAVISGICANGQSTVVIDLRELTFIDSSGLQALMNAQQDCGACGHELRIVPGPDNVQRLFELTGLSDTLPFTDGAAPVTGAIAPSDDITLCTKL
jgi:anti-anti-sigma factor